jgi:NAD(P)-dependent dehydrogenase (short-subunit alcohol dehydrogenase family)
MGRLDGRVALVTGGSRGIGAATVLRLASEGTNKLMGSEESAGVKLRTREAVFSDSGGNAITYRRSFMRLLTPVLAESSSPNIS